MFTWKRGNTAAKLVRERLDRGLATANWCSVFPNASIQHLSASVSDHVPILFQTEDNQHKRQGLQCQKRSYFEVSWSKEPDCENLIRDAWCILSYMNFNDRLEWIRNNLLMSYQGRFKGLRREIEKLTDEVQLYMAMDGDDDAIREEIEQREELNRLLEEEETFWM